MKSSFIIKILLGTSVASLVCLVSGLLIGFNVGQNYHSLKNGRVDYTKCNQYTVLDANHVVTACGDTIQYKWKVKPVNYGTK